MNMAEVEQVELFLYWAAVTFFISSISSMIVERRQVRKMWMAYMKPSFAPTTPATFGIVWGILNILQSIAVTRIRLRGSFSSRDTRFDLITYLVLQVVLASYMPLMFKWRMKTASNIATFTGSVLSVIIGYNMHDVGDYYSLAVFVALTVWLIYALALGVGIQALNDTLKTIRRSSSRNI